MKKIFLILVIALGFATSSNATEITNPFHISPKGKLTSTTQGAYKKIHVRKLINGFSDYRTRDKIFTQQFSYGISPKVAVLGNISNAWERKRFDNFGITDKTDSNADWSVGTLYDFYNTENAHFQLRMLYLQEETHHFGGAYKAFNANAKTGYDLEYFLPYVGTEIELPIAQRKDADNNPKYDVYAGLYKNFWNVVAADLTVHYNYDKMYKSKKLNAVSSIDFFITEQIAVGGFFDYTFFDRGKNNADADAHTIGASIKVQF